MPPHGRSRPAAETGSGPGRTRDATGLQIGRFRDSDRGRDAPELHAERLLAILTLAHLRDRKSWDALVVQANMGDSLASIHAARALINIDPLEGTDLLLPMLLQRQDWSIAQLANFLGAAEQAFWLHLTKNILQMDKALWNRALQLAEALHLQLPLQSMRYIIEHCDSTETLANSLEISRARRAKSSFARRASTRCPDRMREAPKSTEASSQASSIS